MGVVYEAEQHGTRQFLKRVAIKVIRQTYADQKQFIDNFIGEAKLVADSLPGGGEAREGQAEMAAAVGRAFGSRRHLVVQAGTGTGKSLAYLVPAALSGEKVVVATATKALQDQLAGKDLPMGG